MSQLKFDIGMHAIQLVWHGGRPIGTSFSFLRPDWVATAKHVVIDDADTSRNPLLIHFGEGPKVPAEIVAVHPETDVAILRLLEPGPVSTPLFPAYHRFAGQNGLVSIGYTPSKSDPTKGAYTAVVNLIPKFEIEERHRTGSKEDVIVFESPGIECGHSGGPMLGLGGGVVGVVIEVFQRDEIPFARATSILSLLDGLEFRQEWHRN